MMADRPSLQPFADHFAPGMDEKYSNQLVCMSVCLPCEHISKQDVQISLNFRRVLPMAVAKSSTVSVVICTSGFVDDVIFAIAHDGEAWVTQKWAALGGGEVWCL